MPELVIDDMQAGYAELVRYVVMNGRPRAPRGFPTRDVRDMTVTLRHPERALTEHIGRKASTRLAALEALEVVAGASFPAQKVRIAPNTVQFLDGSGDFHGAYGPRLGPNVQGVIDRLTSDPDTRQAIINIYDVHNDDLGPHKDVPCNVMVMYDIEDGRLNAHTVVRSNDVWWGVAHDVFTFTVLQRTLAAFLNLDVGEYSWTARSMHVYERDFDAIAKLHSPTKPAAVTPHLCPAQARTWDEVRGFAASVVTRHVTAPSWWNDVSRTWQL